MRIVLFYSGVESFNYFTDQLENELQKRGHETFILDLSNPEEENPHSYAAFSRFAAEKIDMVICYDGLGIKQDMFIEFWDANNALVVNILMDHPLRFHETMQKHPRKYIQFCCDRNHVDYVKKYFLSYVENVEFMPHAGTINENEKIPGSSESMMYYFPERIINRKAIWSRLRKILRKIPYYISFIKNWQSIC